MFKEDQEGWSRTVKGNKAGEMPGQMSLKGRARSLDFFPSWTATGRF